MGRSAYGVFRSKGAHDENQFFFIGKYQIFVVLLLLLLCFYPSLLLSWMFEHDCLDTCCFWCVLYFCIRIFSAQLSMFQMERRSRNTLITTTTTTTTTTTITIILIIKKGEAWPSGQASDSRVADLGLNLALPVGLLPGRVIPVT